MDELIISILQRTLVASTPLLLGTLGEIVTERAGILNLGVEGMMAVGAISGFIVSFNTGNPYLGMLVSLFAGAFFSLIHAFVSVHLQANQVVSGLALTMTGLGLASLAGKPYVGQSLEVKIQTIEIPLLSDIPLIGPVLFSQDAYFYLAIAMAILLWFLLRHSAFGISLRSVGENPVAAESQGISSARIRYLAVAIGGALSGLAGSNISTSYSRTWIEGITQGRGWIVIALTIFALWQPLRAIYAAILFGGIFVLQFILQPLGISPNLLAMLPYLGTILILVIFGMNKNRQRVMLAPAMLGEPFKPGER